ncbi:MAG: biotin--[acetyl-CoA-carboxylase] ligase [Acidimicrobiales bacterium]|nr:biotin--[acetyl-CoA-carboxylase] ligase [Acidimicrobiales bacterium]
MSDSLDPISAAVGTRFTDCRWVAETGSTNADLLADGPGPTASSTVLVADHQTAGRGRLDRRWQAPPGRNLLLSIRLDPAEFGVPAPAGWGRFGTALAVAAVEAIGAVGVGVGVKWPNDIVALGAAEDHGKVGGMLAEATSTTLVLGLGLNVGWPGPDSPGPDSPGPDSPVMEVAPPGATSLRRLGYDGDRQTVLRHLLAAYDRWLDRITPGPDRADGPDLDGPDLEGPDLDGLRAAYVDCCVTLGRPVRIERAAKPPLTGTATGLTAAGHLVLTDEAGALHEISVGDVVHLRRA